MANMSAEIENNPGLSDHGADPNLLGWKLLAAQLITEPQLKEALERQKAKGGRLGENLNELGFLTLDRFNRFLKKHPDAPKTVEETGLELSFLAELILKHILFLVEFKFADIAERVKLPVGVVDPVVEFLRQNKFVEIKGASQFLRSAYRLALTDQGRKRAAELLEICGYVGPTPVPLEDYRKMTVGQTVKNVNVTQETLNQAFSHLVVNERTMKRLGPAIISGKSIFLYGPPGNGKSAFAEAIGNTLTETVYIPHAILVGGEIIRVFDPVNHIPAEPEVDKGAVDPRWVLIKRPVVVTGGELTLKSLDLEFDSISKFYLAPLQMKANNGLFIIDDFGRQPIEPKMLLNRWVVPLERKIDFMTLHTGMKFEIPFDELIIFCTNIEPKTLMDEAFLRRIRYKIHIGHPTEEEFQAIFMRVCEDKGVPFDQEVFDHLWENCYRKFGVTPNACHPRDLIEFTIDDSRYYRNKARLTKEGIIEAWNNYFVEK